MSCAHFSVRVYNAGFADYPDMGTIPREGVSYFPEHNTQELVLRTFGNCPIGTLPVCHSLRPWVGVTPGFRSRVLVIARTPYLYIPTTAVA